MAHRLIDLDILELIDMNNALILRRTKAEIIEAIEAFAQDAEMEFGKHINYNIQGTKAQLSSSLYDIAVLCHDLEVNRY